ncbi:hypothetical protein K2173_023909 [Erythroxylum novogranatense]|uniref:non-specific serine/threonine protein kinase n=1 Tax=Erythroxylum novogranatense TaxID=1862640 RepID=A0AAV8TSQ6_9ROSI|nr:hypothetical protein K2173_023909 [Erythroxylum novogranatense]
MAVLKSWISRLQSTNIHFLLSLFIIISFTSVKSSATPIKFSFSRFDQNNNEIFLEKDASVSDGEIQLTLNQLDKEQRARFGRATYSKPLHLWDRPSGNLTNFTTHFSFIINSLGSDVYGDGIAFFLAPNGSRLYPDVRDGGGLGLARNFWVATNKTENHFVAVEFDTYQNEWDPKRNHVGIDVNSMESIVNVSWNGGIKQGNKTDVWINYDSSLKFLDVKFTYIGEDNLSKISNISTAVDLANYLPEWVTIGFSGSTGYSYEINTICSWDFNSTTDIVENHESDVVLEPAGGRSAKENKWKIQVIAGFSIGACVLITGVVLIYFVLKRKRKKQRKADFPLFDVSFGDDFKNGTGGKNFSYDELVTATNNFSETQKLGEGGSGAVYKGYLKDLKLHIAVKRVLRLSKQGIKEYASEVKIISRIRHKNLVKLIGWCHEKELLLAYEFMPNGSLDAHLFKGKSLLSWEVRHKIAQDLASALFYLHEEGDQCVLHRDIKPSNIMLDSNFIAKLGDFGLARLVDHAKGCRTTILAGTMGYMAPECFKSGNASKESDIYSFGVVTLEIACGKRVVESWMDENQATIVEWVWELYSTGKILEAADQKLCGNFDEEQMKRVMIVGLWCVHPDRKLRPSIRQVINILLNFETPLPVIPTEMPMPSYLAPPSKPSSFYHLSTTSSSVNSNGRHVDSSNHGDRADSPKHETSLGDSFSCIGSS